MNYKTIRKIKDDYIKFLKPLIYKLIRRIAILSLKFITRVDCYTKDYPFLKYHLMENLVFVEG